MKLVAVRTSKHPEDSHLAEWRCDKCGRVDVVEETDLPIVGSTKRCFCEVVEQTMDDHEDTLRKLAQDDAKPIRWCDLPPAHGNSEEM